MFFPPVVFEIKAHAGQAMAELKTLNAELGKLEVNAGASGMAMARLGTMSKFAGTALLGMGAIAGIVAVTSLEALDKVETAQANLETAIKNTGVAYEDAKPYVDAHVKSMQSLGFTAKETMGALSYMTAALGSPKKALDSLSVAADMARFKHMSLADAGRLLAKASTGQARGLADLGLKMGITIKKGASYADILKAIEDRTKGAADAYKHTLGGSLEIARANFEALQVQIGTYLLPYAIQFTNWITNTALPAMKDFFGYIKDHVGLVKTLALTIAGIWIGSKIVAGVSVTITIIKSLIAVYNALKVAAGLAMVMEAGATGGTSLIAAAAAMAAAGALVAGVSVIANKLGQDKAPTGIYGTGSHPSTGGIVKTTKTPGSIEGKGVTVVPSKTTTVNQNVTVYATNTNDIAKKLSKAATNGLPIGTK